MIYLTAVLSTSSDGLLHANSVGYGRLPPNVISVCYNRLEAKHHSWKSQLQFKIKHESKERHDIKTVLIFLSMRLKNAPLLFTPESSLRCSASVHIQTEFRGVRLTRPECRGQRSHCFSPLSPLLPRLDRLDCPISAHFATRGHCLVVCCSAVRTPLHKLHKIRPHAAATQLLV